MRSPASTPSSTSSDPAIAVKSPGAPASSSAVKPTAGRAAIPVQPSVDSLLARCAIPTNPVPDWLAAARGRAASWATERGLPTRKDEDWKYTPLAPLLAAAVQDADMSAPAAISHGMVELSAIGSSVARIVFVNGAFSPRHSSLDGLPVGVKVTSLAADIASGDRDLEAFLSPRSGEFAHAFEAINAAAAADGAVIRVEADADTEGLIELVFWSDGCGTSRISQPRSIVVAGSRSRVSFVENYAGPAGAAVWTNAVTQVVVGPGAQVDHYKVQDEPDTGFHLGLLDVVQEAGSRFSSLSIALGSRIARHEVRVRLDGEQAHAALSGLYLPGGDRHHDNPVLVVHAAPNCTSRQLYKGIASDHGHGVFNGHLVVLPGADGTDASQTNKNLLLSDHAEIDTRPRLEILTDDVKCSHGAAVGALDPDAVFYLRSRGIALRQAKSILTTAFAGEIVERIPAEALRLQVEALVAARLGEEENPEAQNSAASGSAASGSGLQSSVALGPTQGRSSSR